MRHAGGCAICSTSDGLASTLLAVNPSFQLLSRLGIEMGVGPLLVGGFALQAHGVFWNTMDIDCLIAEDEIGRIAEKVLDFHRDQIEREA